MLPRFYAPGAERSTTVVTLPDEEAAHLSRVLRLKAGDEVRVFDGRGHEWRASVEVLGKKSVSVRLGRTVDPPAEPGVAITLAAAVLKSDSMDEVMRDAVMLGVAAIKPLVTERTEVTMRALARAARLVRWQRIAVASAKQCGRAVVPPVDEPRLFGATLAERSTAVRLLLVEPGAVADARVIALHQVPRASAVELLVGPEGGWTPREIDEAAASGAMLMTLGRQTLRAVSAPIVAISALRAVWKDL